jgi:hypothetical protein
MGGIYEVQCSDGIRCHDINTKFHKDCQLKVKVMLRPTVSWPVCLEIEHPCGTYDQIFITVRQLRIFWCGALSLTRGRVTVAVGPRQRSHSILLSQIQDISNLEGQVPVFISPRNRVAQLHPQALGSIFVASLDSKGYGGGNLPRLHTGTYYTSIARNL